MKVVSVFGNPDLAPDAVPISLLPLLRVHFPAITFEHVDPNEECAPPEASAKSGKPWWIIDTVKGIDKVTLIDEKDLLVIKKRLTMHDYDLGMHLVLLKKIYPDLKLRIIGVPFGAKAEEVIEKIIRLLNKSIDNN
jgi:hypothetical protein